MATSASPITIFRGDDTDAFSLRTISIKLSGDLDLTSATAEFSLLNFEKSWDSIPSSGTLTFSMTSAQTKAFPLGNAMGTLRLYDGTKQLTVVNTIPFRVTDKVCGAPTQEFDLNVTLAVDTEINIEFVIEGGSGGDGSWSKDASSEYLYPTDNSVQRVVVPALANVDALGSRYTLADVKNLANTILTALKI